jgi:carbamate kinase
VKERLLVALGGNALVRVGQRGTLGEQAENLRVGLLPVVEAARRGATVLVTHGNGPQVGHLLLRAEAARGRAYDVPLDVCVAQSQGETGYLLARTLRDLLARRGIDRPVAVVLTQTVVPPDLGPPVKPVGPDRRLVPSPRPIRIVEADAVRRLLDAGSLVVAAGGGGIPVVERKDGSLRGVEAVVDKDLASALLALETGIERLLILTTVPRAALRFGTAEEEGLDELTAHAARGYLSEGHFLPGSMGPKVEAAVRFVEGGGRSAVIAHLDHGIEALDGRAGTRIRPDAPAPSEEEREHAARLW